MGERLRQGHDGIARNHGFTLRQTGPAQMPMVLFDGDADLHIANAFTVAALRHGIYLHPKHNMFLCTAHTPDDIDRALHASDLALRDIVAAGVGPTA